MTSEKTAILDHIIVLLPHEDLLDPPSWLTDRFNITPGGKHADGKTENKLIVFEDGTYIELISFTSPAAREGHWWGQKPYGIIDWAFSSHLSPDDHHKDLISRLADLQDKNPDNHFSKEEQYSYAPPQRGGRTRPDGIVLEWAVTFPTLFTTAAGKDNPGEDGITIRPANLPFFCHDITPRKNRISGGLTTHPCGAKTISAVSISIGSEKFSKYVDLVSAAVGGSGKKDESGEGISIEVHLPSDIGSSRIDLQDDLDSVDKGDFIINGLKLQGDDPEVEIPAFKYP